MSSYFCLVGRLVKPVQGRGHCAGQLLCEAGRDPDGEVHEPGGGLQLLHQRGAAGPRCRAPLPGSLHWPNTKCKYKYKYKTASKYKYKSEIQLPNSWTAASPTRSAAPNTKKLGTKYKTEGGA